MGKMTPERWKRLQEILDEFDELSASERSAFLDRRCADDPALRQEIEALIEHDDELDERFETPLFPICSENLDQGVLVPRVGPYTLVREVGEGGMGTVYLAVQSEPFQRQVALKLIRPEVFGDQTVLRFEQERALLARLRHPNVAHLYDGGTTADGRPYLVMEYVEGEPIEQYCEENDLSRRQRLELFLQVTSAVHLAHQQLRVVHRDLKPSNILVTPDGTAKLLDFGIAKSFDASSSSSAIGAAPGTGEAPAMSAWTPNYTSPEQLAGKVLSTASDVYSLGALLYRLLTERLPYGPDISDPGDALEAMKKDPDAPRLNADLDALILKAMAREPEARYGSVEGLESDLRCYLGGLPILARKPTFSYRAGKFARRHRWPLVLVATLVTWWVGWNNSQAEKIAQGRRMSASMVGLIKALAPVTSDQKVELQAALEQAGAIVDDPMFERQPLDQSLLMDALGWTYLSLERFDLAESFLIRALAKRREALDGEDQLVAESLNNLGLYYQKRGRPTEAEARLEEALGIYDRHDEPDLPGLTATLANLAIVRHDQGRYREAEEDFRKLLELRQSFLGDDHTKILQTRSNLASVLVEQGIYDEAERLHRQNLEVRLARYGSEHAEIGKGRNQLASVLYASGNLAAAEVEAREALRIRREIFGPDSIRLAATWNNLGQILQAQNAFTEAEDIYRRVIELSSRRLGKDHRDVAIFEGNLASVLSAKGETTEAEVSALKALAVLKLKMAPGSWRISNVESVLGGVLTTQGRFEESEELLVPALAVIRGARGERAPYTRDAARRLISLYESWGRPQAADPYRTLATNPYQVRVSKIQE